MLKTIIPALFLGLGCATKQPNMAQAVDDLPDNVVGFVAYKGGKIGSEVLRDALVLAKENNLIKGQQNLSDSDFEKALNHPDKMGFDLNYPIVVAVLTNGTGQQEILVQLAVNDSKRAQQTRDFFLNQMGESVEEHAHDGRLIKTVKHLATVEYNSNMWFVIAQNNPIGVLTKAIDDSKTANMKMDETMIELGHQLQNYPLQIVLRGKKANGDDKNPDIQKMFTQDGFAKTLEKLLIQALLSQKMAYGLDYDGQLIDTRFLMPLSDKNILRKLSFTENKDQLINDLPLKPMLSTRSDVHMGTFLDHVEDEPEKLQKTEAMFTKKLGFNVIDWLRDNYEGPLTLNLYPSNGDSFVSAVLHFKLKTTDEIEKRFERICQNMDLKPDQTNKHFKHCFDKDSAFGLYKKHGVFVFDKQENNKLRHLLGAKKGAFKGLKATTHKNRLIDLNIDYNLAIDTAMMSKPIVDKMGGLNAALLATMVKRILDINNPDPFVYRVEKNMLVFDNQMRTEMMQASFVMSAVAAIAIPNIVKANQKAKKKRKEESKKGHEGAFKKQTSIWKRAQVRQRVNEIRLLMIQRIEKGLPPIQIESHPKGPIKPEGSNWGNGNPGFVELGLPWTGKRIYGRYEVLLDAGNPKGFMVVGHCDLDGDGLEARIEATEAKEAAVINKNRF